MSTLALVPARGGSQGILRKNLLDVGGRPLITWSIAAALAARRVDRVLVSTDDDEIAEVAAAAGAEVPFRRPDDLAGPDVADLPVFQHALAWLERDERYRPEVVVHLRPTSPVRPAGLVDDAVSALDARPDATSLRSVSPAPATPWKMWDIDDDDLLQPLLGSLDEEAFNQPRQSLPPAWLHDGVIDVVRSHVIASGSMTGPRILAYRSPPGVGVDIDRQSDVGPAEEALTRLTSTAAAPRRRA